MEVAVGVGVNVAVAVGVEVAVAVVAVAVGLGVGVGPPLTVTTIESLPDSALSLAVSCRLYVPAAEKVAVVLAAFGLANVTVPGPLSLLHEYVNAPGGFGSPSSVAEPLKVAHWAE